MSDKEKKQYFLPQKPNSDHLNKQKILNKVILRYVKMILEKSTACHFKGIFMSAERDILVADNLKHFILKSEKIFITVSWKPSSQYLEVNTTGFIDCCV